jgi:predicted glycoside hydrolase/deacetylase ChbG (UPF0249 family)
LSLLIVNADDLGIHPSIDAGIAQAYQQGIVTSATLFVTTPFFEQAVKEVVEATGIPVGLHLSLTTGKSCAPPARVPLLVNRDGFFRRSAIELYRCLLTPSRHPALLEQATLELEAQFQRARGLGIEFTHFDGHQNIHRIPALWRRLGKIAPVYGFHKARAGKEWIPAFALRHRRRELLARGNFLKVAITSLLCPRSPRPFVSPQRFAGLLYSGVMDREAMLLYLEKMRPGVSWEVALHPGIPAPPDHTPYPDPRHNAFISSPARAQELQLCLDPTLGQAIAAAGFHLGSYRDL